MLSHLKDAFAIHGVERNLNSKGGSSFLVPQGFRAAQNTLLRVDGKVTKFTVYTREMSLLGPDGRLTKDGMKKLEEKLLEARRLDDLDDEEEDDMEDDLI